MSSERRSPQRKSRGDMSSDLGLVERVLTLFTMIAVMQFVITMGETKLIKRYNEKSIVDITKDKIERMYTCDTSGLNDLFQTVLPRIEKLIEHLVLRHNSIDDIMYNKTMIEFTEKFSFGKDKQLDMMSEKYSSIKIICETREIGSGLPIPDPPEYKEFARTIAKMGLDRQMLPTVEANTDIIVITNGKSLLDQRNQTYNFTYNTGITSLKGQVFNIANDDTNLEAKKKQLCLLPRKLEKTTIFHKNILDKKAPNYIKLLRSLKMEIGKYLTAGFTNKPLITTLKEELPIPKAVHYLYDCVNHYDLNNIIFNPDNKCHIYIKSLIAHIKDLNDLLYLKKPTVKNGYEEYGAQKVNNNTMILTVKRPDVIIGQIYELYHEGGGPFATYSYVLFKADQSCYAITENPEIIEDKVILRSLKKLSQPCCYGLINNNGTKECYEKKEIKYEPEISPTTMLWAFT